MIQTEAIVLHGFDYRETSRIVRLATRDAGVVSAIARGAKRPRSRYGHGLDLFTSGVAHLLINPSRDLHTLAAFDASRARPSLAGTLERFAAAAAIAEFCLRFGSEDAQGTIHEVLETGLDALAEAEAEEVAPRTLGTVWRLVAELGFAPALEQCAACHRPLEAGEVVRFGHRVGGALCASCAPLAPGARFLPAEARATLAGWIEGAAEVALDAPSTRAHQRLLREFLEEHLADGRALRAWAAWEGAAR